MKIRLLSRISEGKADREAAPKVMRAREKEKAPSL